MKKQRMQADNVQQLMEIVRALQNGEEPDMDKIREKTQMMKKKEKLGNIYKPQVRLL